jgi:hypothetical protein
VTLCPRAGRLKGLPSSCTWCTMRVRVLSGQAYYTHLPTSHPFLNAKAIGHRGHHAVQGREVGEVEVGLIRFKGKWSRWPCLAGLRLAGPS